ncbi:hypothetical protein COV81_00930 [Candidatus Peregrinibacteria bacterium CG11_big_fil_rev_8_21_14_0_20_41_10]|nr:MAG: hypothetical protein COV81_00930 [Candidatus Peregrinibacteria bacterium CG11_big_fil_rev_8_21_14_0_20_41_10]PJC38109.1 MAG: hypothetical protein CO045_01865 [Candidatus Peregrinibacteria bacterium CG_4_9_14_0_2_um_filter_41_14]
MNLIFNHTVYVADDNQNIGDDNGTTEGMIPLNLENKPEPTVSFNLDPVEPQSAENSDLVDTIVKQSTAVEPEAQPSMLSKLGDEQVSQAELTSLEFQLKNNARLANVSRNVFVSIVIIGTMMGGYFFFRFQSTQQTTFKANLTLSEVTDSRVNLENAYNYELYRLIDRSVQDLVWDAMELIQYYQVGSDQAISLRQLVNQRLSSIGALTSRLTIFNANDPKAARASLVAALPKELENTSVKGVMRNQELHEAIANSKSLEAIIAKPNTEFMPWLEEFLASLEIPETILLKVNKDRMLWSQIIANIEAKTREIDPFFGNPANEFITYSNYNFDSRTNKITLTGQIKTEDNKTFTRIADLIDIIEADPHFQNVDHRSFTKNPVPATEADLASYYEATLQLDFEFIRDGATPTPEPAPNA